ncbi:MAG TPA: DUF3821 domain-containing protein [Methanoregula sp.]|nr:DUF3821 domain-containing protein [Methanoregula sp.]
MQLPVKLSAFIAILVVLSFSSPPAAALLNKISAGAVPVFIGESNLDISSGLNGCHTIAWWPNGTDINSQDPGKNITIFPINSVSTLIYHYNFSPDVFTGYTGTWYCQDKNPYYPVFMLYEPQISIKIWDLDSGQDVSGQSIPFATNITYRIDTNMVPALSYASRPTMNPTDSFYTVSMADPRGKPVSILATGSAGNSGTVNLPFDASPFITSSPYYGKNMQTWSHTARDIQGYVLYPAGTYTITARANLNNMQDTYAASGVSDTTGKITSTASVTLVQPMTATTAVTTSRPAVMTTPPAATSTGSVTPVPTATPVAKKTTYSPIPAGISLLGIAAAGTLAVMRRR